MTFQSLYEFTETGLLAFEKVFTGQLSEDSINLSDATMVTKLSGTRSFESEGYNTAKDMAGSIIASIGTRDLSDLLYRRGLWGWLTFVLRDTLFPKAPSGQRKFGEVHRWYPASPNDWQKGQRHLVRMPVLLLSSLGNDADHLLCGPPSVLPEIREQLTSQQDMFHHSFQRAARTLYFDEEQLGLKRGAGSKGGGSPRRLAKVRLQLDVTWNLYDLSSERILEFLPKEFDRFKPLTS